MAGGSFRRSSFRRRSSGAASPGLDSSFGSMPSLHGGGASRSLPELGAEGGGTDAWWVANAGGLSGDNLEQDTLDQLQLAKTLRSLADAHRDRPECAPLPAYCRRCALPPPALTLPPSPPSVPSWEIAPPPRAALCRTPAPSRQTIPTCPLISAVSVARSIQGSPKARRRGRARPSTTEGRARPSTGGAIAFEAAAAMFGFAPGPAAAAPTAAGKPPAGKQRRRKGKRKSRAAQSSPVKALIGDVGATNERMESILAESHLSDSDDDDGCAQTDRKISVVKNCQTILCVRLDAAAAGPLSR